MKEILIQIKNQTKRFYNRVHRLIVTPDLPVNEDGKVYINLGCGPNSGAEYINVDAVPWPHTHYVGDIQDLSMFRDSSVDLVYASHVTEHIPRKDLIKTLREWRRVLKDGGILRIGVPDFDKLIGVYKGSDNDVNSIVNQLLGQDGVYDDHHTIWNYKYAEEVLRKAGFREVSLWDYKTVDHRSFKDKSSRVMEAGGKQIPISLNVQAVK